MKSSGRPRIGPDIGQHEAAHRRLGAGIFADRLDDQRDDGERGDGIAEPDPVPLEQIGGDEGRGETAETEEEVDEVQRGGAMRLADAADQRIGASDHDAAADAEQEEKKLNTAEARERGRQKSATAMKRQAKNEADFVALGIEQRPDAKRGDHQPQRLRKCDGAVLRGSQVETIGKFGQNGAQHGGDHSIDEDGQDGGKDQHGRDLLSIP